MSFLDNLTKKVSQSVDRARFEADKLQRTLRMESELGDLKRQLDGKRLEFGDRALELYRAGMIQSPTLGSILREIEAAQQKLTLKEEELKIAQAEQFSEAPGMPPAPPSQSVPVVVEPAAPAPQPAAPQAAAPGTKLCPTCQFQMPSTSLFCPSCGTRLTQ